MDNRSLTIEYLFEVAEIKILGQAQKGLWWIPWRQQPMKGVASCDKLREAANRRWSGDTRMGKLCTSNIVQSPAEYIGWRR